MARQRSPLIVVTDGWLANAGDAAILIAMRRSLARAIPGAQVVFCCHHRHLVGHRYPELELAPPLDALAGVRWPWTGPADVRERGQAQRLVERADLVLVPGGGFMFEHYGAGGRLAVHEMLLERGRRLGFYSQSIGAFRDAVVRRRLAQVLRAASLVLVRDRDSYETVRALGGVSPLHLTADEAVLLRHRPVAPLRGHRSLLATVSLHPWWMNGDGVCELDSGDMAAVAASLSRALAGGLFKRITLASTTQGLGGARWRLEDDTLAALAVRDAMPPQLARRVRVVPGYLSAGEYARLAARHTAVVSMRMHGAILAMTAGTPALLANGSVKARSLLEESGEIPILRSRAGLERLDEHLHGLVERRRERRRAQARAVAALRSRAEANARHVAALL